MERVIYIRQGLNLHCKSMERYDYGYRNCTGDTHPCMEINVIAEDEVRCMSCDRRIDCLVKPQRCQSHVYWHICSGDSSGVYYTPNYQGVGYLRDRNIKKVEGDEKKFFDLTGLTFGDVVNKLYGT